MKKISICWLMMIFIVSVLQAQSIATDQPLRLIGAGDVQSKGYYLLTLIQHDGKVAKLLQNDGVLLKLTKEKQKRLEIAMGANDYHRIIKAISYKKEEEEQIVHRLTILFGTSKHLQSLVEKELRPSGCYNLFNQLNSKQLLSKALEADINGLNWTLGVYGEGQNPRYSSDGINFNVNNFYYPAILKTIIQQAINGKYDRKIFFGLSLHCALVLLKANDRLDAANYEPMESTVNKLAILKVKQINWKEYPYTVLLVPGQGPANYNDAISVEGKIRCRIAAEAYRRKLAPFIIVSGGKVHPDKTEYCEAEQMKKYLIDSLQIAENAVIMEPHARHTPTNMRNGTRLMIRYGLPLDKPGLVTTDKEDNDYMVTLYERCQRELGYVPYRLAKRVTDTELEFYPEKSALQINSTEPLDP